MSNKWILNVGMPFQTKTNLLGFSCPMLRCLEKVPNIFSELVGLDGEESHGIPIRKKSHKNKSKPIRKCEYACMYVCMYVCMCMYVYVCVCMCMYVCMYACMYVCMQESRSRVSDWWSKNPIPRISPEFFPDTSGSLGVCCFFKGFIWIRTFSPSKSKVPGSDWWIFAAKSTKKQGNQRFGRAPKRKVFNPPRAPGAKMLVSGRVDVFFISWELKGIIYPPNAIPPNFNNKGFLTTVQRQTCTPKEAPRRLAGSTAHTNPRWSVGVSKTISFLPNIPYNIHVWYIYIYLHLPWKSTIHVDRCISRMDAMGMISHVTEICLGICKYPTSFYNFHITKIAVKSIRYLNIVFINLK